jgi:catechol 2,3-dioxygenase-like lactoylglutathione lyase family enzyme
LPVIFSYHSHRQRTAELMLKHCILLFSILFFFGHALPQPVTAVDAIGMTVSDMDKAVDFYANVLTFEKVSDVEVWGEPYERLQGLFGLRMRVVRMKLGEEAIELTEYLAPQGRPFPVDSRSNDHWFQHIAIVVSDMEKAYQRLRQFKVKHASSSPQRIPDWNKGAAGIKAFYFRDPDGHYLEVIYFPPGKGSPKWQTITGKLFLGIDHTAIVVGNTDESLKFYRDALGLQVEGESENYGTEQEYLNNVFGARLHISGLRAASGPGIEFLEYLAPGGGRPTPVDIKPNDIAHWQTRLVVQNTERAWRTLRGSNGSFVTPGPATLPDRALGFTNGMLVRDPDGHAVLLMQGYTQSRGVR